MKAWHYDQIAPAANGCISGTLAEWPYLAEALTAQGIRLPTNTLASALQAICRLILAERKTTDARRGSELVKQLQASLLERGIYVNPTDICECYRQYSETYESQSWVEDLATWDGLPHIGPVDYIAARIGSGKPN